MNIIDVLIEDHRTVEQLFTTAQQTSPEQRSQVLDQLEQAVEQHAQIEENIVYPEFERVTGDSREAQRARAEHQDVRLRFQAIRADENNMNLLTTLATMIRGHVSMEETDMFPRLRHYLSGDVLEEMGNKALAYKDASRQQ